ncbi:MAG: nucleotidyltransferase [Methylophilaceae bacterium]|nr:nucleotidyltransferase [Methylophilaceae bacterium]
MPTVQKQFEDFHSLIKLDEDNEQAKLRQKRDILLEAFPDDVPSFEHFNQGSYSMHTGVVPPNDNYDIDVGIVFKCQKDKYPDPVVLKKKVRDALNTHGRNVSIRRSCVTVNYMRGEDVDYHVDLAIYVKRDDGLLDLAKGKENSSTNERFWEVSDPKQLKSLICTAFDDEVELAQYRRCIRYIKRWRDIQFSNGGAPLSIALTVAAKLWFQPHLETSGNPSDLIAMRDWIKELLSNFKPIPTDEGLHERLTVELPVSPYGDLMKKVTNIQMDAFKQKLEALLGDLEEAYYQELPEDACELLNKQFGDDFRIPEKSTTAKSVTAPLISTGNAA